MRQRKYTRTRLLTGATAHRPWPLGIGHRTSTWHQLRGTRSDKSGGSRVEDHLRQVPTWRLACDSRCTRRDPTRKDTMRRDDNFH